MQRSVRALKAASKLHSYSSAWYKNNDTQKYTYIMHKKHTHTLKLTEEEYDFKKFC